MDYLLHIAEAHKICINSSPINVTTQELILAASTWKNRAVLRFRPEYKMNYNSFKILCLLSEAEHHHPWRTFAAVEVRFQHQAPDSRLKGSSTQS